MVIKECYRHLRHYEMGHPWKTPERFKENVIKTYQLFTEIAQELEQSNQMEA